MLLSVPIDVLEFVAGRVAWVHVVAVADVPDAGDELPDGLEPQPARKKRLRETQMILIGMTFRMRRIEISLPHIGFMALSLPVTSMSGYCGRYYAEITVVQSPLHFASMSV
jgi:hypothetical protein